MRSSFARALPGTLILLVLIVLLAVSLPFATASANPVSETATESKLQHAGVNELGVIPVLMYHVFTTGVATDIWTRSIDDFRNDLLWLYEHDFYVISARDLLDDTIDVPLGKHPVVLTFDDSSANQFQFTLDQQGELVPTPDSAVGVMEAFYAEHPDFGRGGHFAVVGSACFANVYDPQGLNTWDTHCPLKLQWLSDNGYEVGNHTWSHPNLAWLGAESVVAEVGRNAAFIDQHVRGPGNQKGILTLPYGEFPPAGALANGAWWNGKPQPVESLLKVTGGSMHSPSSSWFDPMAISRFNTDPTSLAGFLWDRVAYDDILLYTSDGDPDTVTVPDPLPEFLQNEFDPDLIAASGKTLVQYPAVTMEKPEVNATDLPPLVPGIQVVTFEWSVRLREEPSTSGTILVSMPYRTELTIVSGPVEADGYTWWQVRLADGTEGWVVEDFLAVLDHG